MGNKKLGKAEGEKRNWMNIWEAECRETGEHKELEEQSELKWREAMQSNAKEGQEGEMTGRQDGDEGMFIIGHACSAQIGLILTTALLIFLLSRCQPRYAEPVWCILYFLDVFMGAFQHKTSINFGEKGGCCLRALVFPSTSF